MTSAGQHRDSWGNATKGCEAVHELGRTTWTLCGKDPVAIGVYGDGNERRLCRSHVNGALRKRTFYADEISEIRTLEGVTTYTLERTHGRSGYMRAVAAAEEEDADEFAYEGFFTHYVCPACGHNDWVEGDARGEELTCPSCNFTGRVAGQ